MVDGTFVRCRQSATLSALFKPGFIQNFQVDFFKTVDVEPILGVLS